MEQHQDKHKAPSSAEQLQQLYARESAWTERTNFWLARGLHRMVERAAAAAAQAELPPSDPPTPSATQRQ